MLPPQDVESLYLVGVDRALVGPDGELESVVGPARGGPQRRDVGEGGLDQASRGVDGAGEVAHDLGEQ